MAPTYRVQPARGAFRKERKRSAVPGITPPPPRGSATLNPTDEQIAKLVAGIAPAVMSALETEKSLALELPLPYELEAASPAWWPADYL